MLFPPVCAFCEKKSKEHLCKKCESQLNISNSCKVDKILGKYFEEHAYMLRYDGMVRDKILSYKFDGKSYMYKTFSKIILNSKKICDILETYDIIVPVPIHKKRRTERGYNQSELIAKEIAKNISGLMYA
ncbi:MAG: double zinc ribbon domain-containing protein, partial [Clostridia bacterium]|nr:double zinc ribbon domain-containing protein [Clostridia bacterium]